MLSIRVRVSLGASDSIVRGQYSALTSIQGLTQRVIHTQYFSEGFVFLPALECLLTSARQYLLRTRLIANP